MCRRDELSLTMSWVGCLLKDSELFILFAENSKILLKISVSKQPTQLIIAAHNCHIGKCFLPEILIRSHAQLLGRWEYHLHSWNTLYKIEYKSKAESHLLIIPQLSLTQNAKRTCFWDYQQLLHNNIFGRTNSWKSIRISF